MATSSHMGDDHRSSSKKRSGSTTHKTGQHVKRDASTGQFMSVKRSSSSKESHKEKH